MLLVRLLVSRRLLVVKVLESQKLSMEFWLCVRSCPWIFDCVWVLLTPVLFRVNCVYFHHWRFIAWGIMLSTLHISSHWILIINPVRWILSLQVKKLGPREIILLKIIIVSKWRRQCIELLQYNTYNNYLTSHWAWQNVLLKIWMGRSS